MATSLKDRNTTANNALEVLNMFSSERLVISAIQVSNHLGTSRSTAYRYLDTLVDMDFLAPAADGGFRIGRRIQELAALDQASDRILAHTRDWTVRLRDEFDETAICVERLRGAETVIRASASSRRLLRVTYDLGAVMPLYAGSPSLVLLIGHSEEQIRSAFRGVTFERFTKDTPSSVDEVSRIVALIRRQGFHISRGQYDPDAASIGVPVFGADPSTPVAGLGLVLPRSRTSSKLEREMVGRLLEASEDVRCSAGLA